MYYASLKLPNTLYKITITMGWWRGVVVTRFIQ